RHNAIKEINAANGMKIVNVVIENDGCNTLDPSIQPYPKRIQDITTEEIIDIIKNAGISGMGGATFPTYAKIQSALGKVQHLIVNCAECEPYITANHRLLLENPAAVINGIKILMRALGLRNAEIAVEDNKLDAINKLEQHLAGSDMIRVRVMKTKYPQGDERQLIYALKGIELPQGKLPADVGCVIFNAETCYAVFDAVAHGMPLIERTVTCDGDCIKSPKNVRVPLGTPYLDVINFCGGLRAQPKKIVNGGPMMGIAQWDIMGPVTKGTSAILVFSENNDLHYDLPAACIRCGRCVKNCPMHLMPNYLAAFSQKGSYDSAEAYSVMSCVECGTCSYNCPGQVPIVQYIRKTKTYLNNRKRAQQAALAASKKETPPVPAPGASTSAVKEMKINPAEKTDNSEKKEGDTNAGK
ncbi:MAG: electron transport complex subunit RsxC, partial [Eubacteriales bacterium]